MVIGKNPTAPLWEVERCCRDETCPGSWWVLSRGSGYIPEEGIFPSKQAAQDYADKLNREKVTQTRA